MLSELGNCSYRPIACHLPLPATCAVINEALNCFGILEFELLFLLLLLLLLQFPLDCA